MRHENSVMHDLLKGVPWAKFEAAVEKHDADRCVRKLSTKSQFIALLHAQLSGSSSLREIVTTMTSHEARLYHLERLLRGDRRWPMLMRSDRRRCLRTFSTWFWPRRTVACAKRRRKRCG
jgi:hypothetical protein